MSITALGSLGTTSVKSAGADLNFSPSRDVPAGRFVALWVAWDSFQNIAAPTNGADNIFCQDSVGNWWCNVGASQGGGPDVAAWAGLFVCQLRYDLLTTSTVTVGDGGSPRKAKALSAEEFNLGDGMRWALNRRGWGFASISDLASQPSEDALDLLYTQEWLVLHALAVEGPNTDTFTWDPDWTQVTGDGTTGGADTDNILIRGGYQIETENSAVVDVTNNTSSTRDSSQAMCGICAVPETTFPTTPLIDDFNRPDENPLDGGLWDTTRTALGTRNLQIASNEVGAGGSLLLDEFEECQEAYVTLAQYGGMMIIYLVADGDAQLATLSGWSAQWATGRGVLFLATAGFVGGANDGYVAAWGSGLSGTKIGLKRTYRGPFSIIGETRLWMDLFGNGDWQEIAAIFLDAIDARAGWPGIAAESGGFLDDFSGGETPCTTTGNRTQIYRWIRA